jgi:glycosyltransferase involved in cell wall biosynthesis
MPFVLDYDDAIFHNYDHHQFFLLRRLFGHRIDNLMARANLVICGNNYLAQRALNAGASWVEILPTVVNLDHYSDLSRFHKNTHPIIVWIGSPSTLIYLNLLHEPLLELSKQFSFTLRVIGGKINLPGVQLDCLTWSESKEVEYITSSDIGVMPLFDTPWEQGKCGYKLIQYMACGLPSVATPVGANNCILQDGISGFFASNHEMWVDRLAKLLKNPQLRVNFGLSSRAIVEQQFCIQVTWQRLANLLHQSTHRRQ